MCFSCRRGTAAHDQMAQRHLHGLVVLIQCCCPDLDDSLVRTRLRGSYLEHFAFDAKFIPRANGSWPAQLVKASADDAAGEFEIAVHQEPHGDRGRVPAACGETSKDRVGRGSLIEMKRLRIELGGKAFDALSIDADAPGLGRSVPVQNPPGSAPSYRLSVAASAPRRQRYRPPIYDEHHHWMII